MCVCVCAWSREIYIQIDVYIYNTQVSVQKLLVVIHWFADNLLEREGCKREKIDERSQNKSKRLNRKRKVNKLYETNVNLSMRGYALTRSIIFRSPLELHLN